MDQSPKTFWQFWTGVFSEPTGEPSYSRVMSGIFVLFMLLLDVIHYGQTGQLPEPVNLLSQAAGGNAAYLINKMQRVFDPANGAAKPSALAKQ